MQTYLGVSTISRITGKPRATILRWMKGKKFGKAQKMGNEYQVSHEQFLIWWRKNMKAAK